MQHTSVMSFVQTIEMQTAGRRQRQWSKNKASTLLPQTWISPRRSPMISSVSVERACVRHVSHTSSVTFTPRNAILLTLATLTPAAVAAAAFLCFRCFFKKWHKLSFQLWDSCQPLGIIAWSHTWENTFDKILCDSSEQASKLSSSLQQLCNWSTSHLRNACTRVKAHYSVNNIPQCECNIRF